MQNGFTVHPATLEDVEVAIEWAASEGWNPGLADAHCFFCADPSGFFVGRLGKQRVSVISAVKYEAHFGFVGLYIVHPEFRGRRFGISTWNHAVHPLATRNLGLDGVLDQAGNYAKMGFAPAHHTIRHRAEGRPHSGSAPSRIPDSALPGILEFDRRYFPAGRPGFIDSWLGQPGVVSHHESSAGTMQAYGVMRPCREGWKIGPLFATTAAAATRVLDRLLNQTGSKPVFLDVPTNNPAAIDLARQFELEPVFETVRMYSRGQPKDVDWSGIYGVTSLELG